MKKELNLKNQAYNIIKQRIINCKYLPGQLLNEGKLADNLKLSRTPLREAINKLESEGFVSTSVQRGILVSPITLRDILQVFNTRLEIEPITLKMATPYLSQSELNRFLSLFSSMNDTVENSFHLDTAMHMYFIENCGNIYIINMMHRVFEENTRIILSSEQNQSHIYEAKQEHTEIIKMILNNNIDEACGLMYKHITSCKNFAIDCYNIKNEKSTSEFLYKEELNEYQKNIN